VAQSVRWHRLRIQYRGVDFEGCERVRPQDAFLLSSSQGESQQDEKEVLSITALGTKTGEKAVKLGMKTLRST
jgi:hypothetical protein